MSDLFNSVINAAADRPAFRQAPVGNYLCIVSSVRKVKAGTGTEGLEFQFTMTENLDGADLDGVDLSKCRLRDTQWVTEKTMPYVIERLGRIAPEAVGMSINDAMDILPGSEVVLTVGHQTEDREGKTLKTPWLQVDRYYSKDWFFTNRQAA